MFFVFILVSLAGCKGNHRSTIDQKTPVAHSKQTASKAHPFKQVDLTKGEPSLEKASYKDLHFAINYESKKDFLHIADASRETTFSLKNIFSGLGVSVRLFDNNETQLLCMELEYEYTVSVHFFVISPESIHESAHC